jgi:hypothetical protein
MYHGPLAQITMKTKSELEIFTEKLRNLMYALIVALIIVVVGIILEQRSIAWEEISPSDHPPGYWVGVNEINVD